MKIRTNKLTVIGGGTGSFTVLSGLKKLENINITSIVPSTDSGGSTGRLRDEFGYLPMGDIRQCLLALAENIEEQEVLRKLFLYRFDKGGNGLEGHNFGNLFMTALRDIVGDDLKAIKYIEKLLNIKGKVYPITLQKCDLVAEYENGEIIKGEHLIDSPEYPHDGRLRINKLYTEPKVSTYTKVVNVIKESDYIIIGPGDLYTSLIANLVINNIAKHIKSSKAKLILIGNLVTKFGQTYEFSLKDHVDEIEKYLNRNVDYILFNNAILPDDILKRYALENAYPVVNDMSKDSRVIEENLLASEVVKTVSGDSLKRSLIRHDSDKIAKIIKHIINQ